MDGPGTRFSRPARHPVNPRSRLRHLWRERSRRTGWSPPDDWWSPCVDTLCAAAVERTDMATACARLGQARARAGVTIGAALDDFAALSDTIGWPAPPQRLVKAVAEGWVDAYQVRDDCRDPLTGLCTAVHLRTRLGEMYRAVDPPAPTDHRIIVVSLDARISAWRRTARLIVLGYELRRFFDRGETAALLGHTRIGVLVPAHADLSERLHDLRFGLCAEHGANIWPVALPQRHEEALTLLDDIGGPRMTE